MNNLLVSLLARIPLDYYPHGCFAPKTLNAPGKKFKKKVYIKFIEKHLITKSRKVVCATESEETHLKEISKEFNTTSVHYPFDVDFFFNSGITYSEFRKENNFKEDDIIFLFVGRWDIYTKGLDILISATKEANRQNAKIKTALVGYSKDEKKLRGLIERSGTKNCVFTLGPMFGESKLAALNSVDYYVQPSRYESFGVSVIEALSVGVPAILSKGCNISREILASKGCYTFNSDPMELADQMLEVTLDKNAKNIGANGRKWVQANLNKTNLESKWTNIYK
nr:glycosyltransferase [Gramella jeungdoensis]